MMKKCSKWHQHLLRVEVCLTSVTLNQTKRSHFCDVMLFLLSYLRRFEYILNKYLSKNWGTQHVVLRQKEKSLIICIQRPLSFQCIRALRVRCCLFLLKNIVTDILWVYGKQDLIVLLIHMCILSVHEWHVR